MPYLQFDLPAVYPADRKRRRVGRLYATLMQTTPRIVKVAFRELGAGNLPPEANERPAGCGRFGGRRIASAKPAFLMPLPNGWAMAATINPARANSGRTRSGSGR